MWCDTVCFNESETITVRRVWIWLYSTRQGRSYVSEIWGVHPSLTLASLLCSSLAPFLPFSFQPSPFSLPSFLLSPPLPFLGPHPLKPATRCGERSELPSQSGQSPVTKWFRSTLGWKIGPWRMVTTVLNRFTDDELQLQVTKWTNSLGVGHPNLSFWGVRTPMTPTLADTRKFLFLVTISIMGAHRIFSSGWQIIGLETKVPQRGLVLEPRWGYEGKAPEADDRCENNA